MGPEIRDAYRDPRGTLIDHDNAYEGPTADRLKAVLREGGAGAPVPLGAMDGQKNPRGYKREMLAAIL